MVRLADILQGDRVLLDTSPGNVQSKDAALGALGQLLGPACGLGSAAVTELLAEREKLHTTGIGVGVAVPHAFAPPGTPRVAAVLVLPHGIEFESLDDSPVKLVFGVIGPKDGRPAHLRLLARVSRLLRVADNRAALVNAESPEGVLELIRSRDQDVKRTP